MTSVTSQQLQLPSLVNKMQPGSAKEIALQLQGHCDRYSIAPSECNIFIGHVESLCCQ